MFKKILMIFICFSGALFVSNYYSNDVNAYVEDKQDYNSDALNSFGITNNYFNDYYQYTRKEIKNNNLNKNERKQLGKDGLLMFAYKDIMGHARPSDVNNKITVHYQNEEFRIVKSGGNYAVDALFLAYIEDLSGLYNREVERDGGKLVQPKITVNGNNVEIYVPYVYYTKEEKQYFNKQFENKLKVLTGKDFNVSFRFSKKENVAKFDKKYDYNAATNHIVFNNRIWKFIMDNNAVNTYNNISNECPRYENGKYMSYPEYNIVPCTLAEFLNDYANRWHNGVSPYTQRFILGNLTWNLFYSAKVERVIFEDYTVTLRAGKYLDIELSEEYLSSYYNEGVLK